MATVPIVFVPLFEHVLILPHVSPLALNHIVSLKYVSFSFYLVQYSLALVFSDQMA